MRAGWERRGAGVELAWRGSGAGVRAVCRGVRAPRGGMVAAWGRHAGAWGWREDAWRRCFGSVGEAWQWRGRRGGACRGVGRRKGGVGLVLPRCAAAVWGRCEGGVRKACYGVLWCEGCVGG